MTASAFDATRTLSHELAEGSANKLQMEPGQNSRGKRLRTQRAFERIHRMASASAALKQAI